MPIAQPLQSQTHAGAVASGWRRGLARLMGGVGGPCEVCRVWSAAAVCPTCRERFGQAIPRCRLCAVDLPVSRPEGSVCGACLRRPPPQSATLAGLRYAYPWDGLIQRFKHHDAVELAGPLVQPLVEAVHRHVGAGAGAWPHLLLPVPLSRQRLRERGYNQAWVLARLLSRRLRVPADAGLIERLVDTPHQQALPRDRRLTNVRGAFMPAPGAAQQLAGRHVALVDDVMTTGATVAEVAATLRRADVADVQVWVVARTPLD